MDPAINWNATLDAPFCHVFRFQGDTIVTFQQYTDTAQWARLMASREPPVTAP